MKDTKGPKVPYPLSLTAWHMRYCRRWGEGNASAGARQAIEEKEAREREADMANKREVK